MEVFAPSPIQSDFLAENLVSPAPILVADLGDQGVTAFRVIEACKYKRKVSCLHNCGAAVTENDLFEAEDYNFKAKVARSMPVIAQNVAHHNNQHIEGVMAQILGQLQGLGQAVHQINQRLAHISTQITSNNIMAAKAFNASAVDGTHALMPVPNQQGVLPQNFPGTLQDFFGMTGLRVDDMFLHLGLDIPEGVRSNRLASHLGIRYRA